MSSLDAAQRRLDDALKRVEAALGQRAQGAGPSDGSPAAARTLATVGAERDALSDHVSQLREECERLNEALAAAQRNNTALRQVNEEVARRLDGTIDELQQLLEA